MNSFLCTAAFTDAAGALSALPEIRAAKSEADRMLPESHSHPHLTLIAHCGPMMPRNARASAPSQSTKLFALPPPETSQHSSPSQSWVKVEFLSRQKTISAR